MITTVDYDAIDSSIPIFRNISAVIQKLNLQNEKSIESLSEPGFAPSKRKIASSKDIRKLLIDDCDADNHFITTGEINGRRMFPDLKPKEAAIIGSRIITQFASMLMNMPLVIWSLPIWNMAISGYQTFIEDCDDETHTFNFNSKHDIISLTTPQIWMWEESPSQYQKDIESNELTQVMTMVWRNETLQVLAAERGIRHEFDNDIIQEKMAKIEMNGVAGAYLDSQNIFSMSVSIPRQPNSHTYGGLIDSRDNNSKPFKVPVIEFHPSFNEYSLVNDGSARILALLSFLRQRIVGVDKERINRAEARRIARSPHDTVYGDTKYVTLRRLEQKQHEASGDAHTEARYHHQYLVNGFWRNQTCGPNNSQRRPTYIDPHIRGPVGAPMLPPRDTVFVARR